MGNVNSAKELIATMLRDKYTSKKIEWICEEIGLNPKGTNESAYDSKRNYILDRLKGMLEPDLKEVISGLKRFGHIDETEYSEINCCIDGVENNKPISQIVFAAISKKPDLNFDLMSNLPDLDENDKDYLVYKNKISIDKGLTYNELNKWWLEKDGLNIIFNLDGRLNECMNNFQKDFYNEYYNIFKNKLDDRLPALIPEIYIKYDSKTIKERNGNKKVFQRMDFALILPNNKKIIIEFDGIQHIADLDFQGNWIPNPEKYALERKLDRELHFEGYSVFRIGNYELQNKNMKEIVQELFGKLFVCYKLL